MLAYMIYVHTRGFWDRVQDGVHYRTRVVFGPSNNTTVSTVGNQENLYSKLTLHG